MRLDSGVVRNSPHTASLLCDTIEEIAKKEENNVTPSTVNRLLALIRSILRKAELKWKWIKKAPSVEIRHEGEKRERWLTQEEI